MSAPPDPDATVSHALQEGLAHVLKAEDGGDWKAVIDWQARHPHLANELAGFLAAQRGIKPLVAPLRQFAPSTVGGLKLREVVGKGAMGVVHRAFDPALKREVAVKLLHPGDELSADERARFRFEAEAMASFDHPHVVPVLASGEEAGLPYLVMPLMGESLAGWLKGLGPDHYRPPTEAARIVRDVALGVHHAHQRGLIHRDLKPANILRDADGRWRVADFGLARPADLTATRVAGTVAYMAPEQTRGGKRLTTAVDVHALGVILFELLTGGLPFGGDVGSVLRKVADEPAPAVRAHRPDVPRDLAAICARCLEKRPEDRYPSALALAEDLDNFLAGRAVRACGRGVFTDITRAVGFRSDMGTLIGRWGFLVGAVSSAFALGWVQTAVWFDAPRWVSWAGLGYYLMSWAVILWVFQVALRPRMELPERVNGVTQFASWIGAVTLTPLTLWLYGGDVGPVFPLYLIVIGVGTFAAGVMIWGQLYVDGTVLMLLAALMPLIPVRYWPGAYGLIVTLAQVRYLLKLRKFSLDSKPLESS